MTGKDLILECIVCEKIPLEVSIDYKGWKCKNVINAFVVEKKGVDEIRFICSECASAVGKTRMATIKDGPD